MFVKRFFVEQCEELKQVTDVKTYIQDTHPTLCGEVRDNGSLWIGIDTQLTNAYDLEHWLAIQTYCKATMSTFPSSRYSMSYLKRLTLPQLQHEIETL